MADYIRRDDALFALRKAERGGSMTALTRLERAYAEIREMPAESEKLVSADGLREWLKKIPLHDLSDGRGLCRIIFAEDFERAMASFPGDAIQIVRCKDCKHKLRTLANGVVICREKHSMVQPSLDDFCSYGERREE